jgi:acetyl-CoA carboxylase biotin carboxyl carrier protein
LSLSPVEIRTIVETLQDSDWDQAVVVIGDVQISVARNGAAIPGGAAVPVSAAPLAPAPATPSPIVPAAAPASAPVPSPAPAAAAEGHVVESPSVGVFWRSPQPGAAPFVEVGSRVTKGDRIGIIEIMKLMTNVAADVSGEVVSVHVENAGTVEFGTPLITIRAEG